jgi:hypothetical protein
MISEMPLPRPYSSICSPEPHEEHAAGREGEDAHEPELHRVRVIVLHEARRGVVHEGDPEDRLDNAQRNRRVARPLLDLLTAGLAFFLELLQRRDDRREELEDDRRRDVRHDAEAEDRALAQVAAGEQRDVVGEAPAALASVRLVLREFGERAWSTPGIGTWYPMR